MEGEQRLKGGRESAQKVAKGYRIQREPTIQEIAFASFADFCSGFAYFCPCPPPVTFASLYQPWAAEKAKTLGDRDDPGLRCIPVSFGTLNVSLFGVGAVGQIIATPKFVTLLTETYHSFKVIPTDGRAHRDDVPPAYRGDSVGHWEGDTFVVDTTNFSDVPWMSAEGRVSFHSDALHIVERYRRVDANTLEIEARVEDPKVLTGPWIVPKQTLTLAPFDQIMDLSCSPYVWGGEDKK